MPLPETLSSYDQELDLLQQALDDPKGIRIHFDSREKALRQQYILNHARSLERKQSKEIYEKGDPQWGRSEYDKLVVRNPVQIGNSWWVYVVPRHQNGLIVERLSEIEDSNA